MPVSVWGRKHRFTFYHTSWNMTFMQLCEQVIAVSCTRLRRLALPKQIPTSCIPTQATGHLRGLQVLGGCMGPSTKAKATKHH